MSGGYAQQQGLALTAAAAERGRAEATAAAAQLQCEVQCYPRTGGSDRVAHRDRTSVDVDRARVDPEVPYGLQSHRGEGFVDLEEVDVGRGQPRAAQRPRDGV